MQHKPWTGFKLMMLQVHGMYWMQFVPLFPFLSFLFLSFPLLCQAKTSADMGHWLGLLLSQSGNKTDPEELTYDYVNAERISTIVTAAKTSL